MDSIEPLRVKIVEMDESVTLKAPPRTSISYG